MGCTSEKDSTRGLLENTVASWLRKKMEETVKCVLKIK